MFSNYTLLHADIYSYYPSPKFWFKVKRGKKPWIKTWKNINGFSFRFYKIGFSVHVGSGYYANSSLWFSYVLNFEKFHYVLFWYEKYDEYLENGGF